MEKFAPQSPFARSAAVRRGLDLAPSPARTRNTAAHTERKLLQAAERVFDRNGYLRTTVQDIVEGTGRSRAAFYRYFRSTDDIFTAHRGVLRAMFEAAYVNPQIALLQARMRSAYLLRVRDHLKRHLVLGSCHPLDPNSAMLSTGTQTSRIRPNDADT